MGHLLQERREVSSFKAELEYLVIAELFRLRDCYRLVLAIVNDNITKEYLRLVNEEIDRRF